MQGLFILEGSTPFVSRNYSELHEALAEDVDPVFAGPEDRTDRTRNLRTVKGKSPDAQLS